MLKQLFKSFTSTSKSAKSAPAPDANIPLEPLIVSRDNHCISRKQISKNALSVIYELRRAGFEAYLVGGGVRDLLLDLAPKDFDIATNATPEQVLQYFRRARTVGRRFKIAHVRFGREIIEVTTFRAGHEQLDQQPANSKQDGNSGQNKSQTNDQGMLLRDNVYGSLRDDALRRDFTINALYYSVDGFTVLDYVGGLEDLKKQQIRIIGEASQRYAEDPVRMLRALRFQAKFDFTLEAKTAAPIKSLGHLLGQVAAPRLFDESLKLFLTGKGRPTFELLSHYQLTKTLFPATSAELETGNNNAEQYYQLICNALSNTDKRVTEEKPVTPAFIYAALLWPVVAENAARLEAEGSPHLRALQIGGHDAVDSQVPIIAIPKRFSIAMREIWTLQQRLEIAHGKRAIAVLQHPRFRAAYDFLLLRAELKDQQGKLLIGQNGESLSARAEFWTQLQIEHPVERKAHSHNKEHDQERSSSDRPRRRRRPRNKTGSPSQ